MSTPTTEPEPEATPATKPEPEMMPIIEPEPEATPISEPESALPESSTLVPERISSYELLPGSVIGIQHGHVCGPQAQITVFRTLPELLHAALARLLDSGPNAWVFGLQPTGPGPSLEVLVGVLQSSVIIGGFCHAVMLIRAA